MSMSDIQKRLQKLLDGELDAAEVAEDPALASLADRLYGIKIQPVEPKKLRDFENQATAPSAPLPATDMMIEVIGDVALEHPPAPSAELPPISPMPIAGESKNKKSFGLMSYASLLGLLTVLANMFGYLHTLVGSMCTDACSNEGHTKMNLLEIYRLDSINGWSLPVTEGVVGIPDVVAVVSLIVMMFLLRKKQ
ncbi:MAG: hypothetical protein CMB36_00955 [Euryarchaeota archaeon]|nr:hypothetical protein [Euryarchaeota archaeon]|tara:strand:- start:9077 stop:9658 length:582 start_codon:yes stop_codon:yes gene_type:complete